MRTTRSSQAVAAALAVVQGWTAEAGLGLHPTKTRVVNAADEGFDFLGIGSRTAVAAPGTRA